MGGFLVLIGMLGTLFGLVNVIYPIKKLGVKGRGMAGLIILGSFVVFVAGGAMLPKTEPAGGTAEDKDKSAPIADRAAGTPDQVAEKPEQPPAPAQAQDQNKEQTSQPADSQEEEKLTEEDVRKASGLKSITSVELVGGFGPNYDQTAIWIHYDLGSVWDETDAVKKSARSATASFEKLFALPNVAQVGIWSDTTFTDQYGKESTNVVTKIVWTKATADKVEWKKFKDMVLVDYKRAFNIAHNYAIHPAVYKELKDKEGLARSGGTEK